MRNRRNVADRSNVQTRRGKCLNCGFATCARALDPYMHLAHTEIQRFTRAILSSYGRGKRRRLLGTLEAGLSSRTPDDGVPPGVRYSDQRIVERGGDVGDAFRLHDLLGPPCSGTFRLSHILFLEHFLLAGDRAAWPLLGSRIGVRALASNRESTAMASTAITADVH